MGGLLLNAKKGMCPYERCFPFTGGFRMSIRVRKILSVLVVIITLVGWYITVFGVGKLNSIKDVMKFGLDINGGVYVVMEADTNQKGEELSKTMEQTRAVLNQRVNAMGLSEATVNLEGEKRLRVEMPGVENADEAIKSIGKTAQLKFLLADGTEILTGKDVKNAAAQTDTEHGGYKIVLEFTDNGTKKFAEATAKASSGQVQSSNSGIAGNVIMIMLDDEIVTAPQVKEVINSPSCEITNPGGMKFEEASNTAALIRGGALPVGLQEVTSSVQTATVGADALSKSVLAGIIGLILVFLLMLLMYNVLGLMADIALALYVLLVLWFMTAIGTVLTLPGIAAIILSIGMAVDANVIIFSRIKDEIGNGKTIRVAVSEGFSHAVVTVLDAQITTLIAAVVLYEIGSTTVKGFAITLMIGIIASIFTAVVISQILIGLIANSKHFSKNKYFGCNEDGTPKRLIRKQFNFIRNRRIFYIISGTVIAVGLIFAVAKGFNYGIDFTGGTMMQFDMGKKVDTTVLEKDLSSFKLDPQIILAGENQDQVIIKTIKALDNDKRQEVINVLSEKYSLADKDVLASEQFGPTVGKELRTNALKAVIIASLCMLVYIIFRFKSWKYGVSSILGLVHDVLVVLAIYAIMNITINNPFIAGILTVVGYSINDTIVIFDRIRENRKLYRKDPLEPAIDNSINQTLNRSVMTSLTTLICIVPLTIMVSTSIREFVIPLMIGVAVGTYSSIFLCSPLLFEFSKTEGKSRYRLQKEKKEAQEKKKVRTAGAGKSRGREQK